MSQSIHLPTPAFIQEYMATSSRGYRLLVLHELAHFLWGLGHGAGFYAYLYGLCRVYGIPVAYAVSSEMEYRKRGAVAGLDRYLKMMEGGYEDAVSRQSAQPVSPIWPG